MSCIKYIKITPQINKILILFTVAGTAPRSSVNYKTLLSGLACHRRSTQGAGKVDTDKIVAFNL